jgi:hypothetical protein
MTPRARRLLAFDGAAAFVAALTMALLRDFLAGLHGFTPTFVLGVAAANAAYGCYSGTLAVRLARGVPPSRRAVDVLIAGNVAWGFVCAALIAVTWPHSTPFGVAHLGLEGAFVAALGVLERRWLRPETR